MSQDPLERVQIFLSETRVNPLALLLDLTTLLPESLVRRALYLAQHESDRALQAFLVHALAERLTNRGERLEITNRYLLPAGMGVEQVAVPEGKEAKRLIAKLSEDQRYKVFEQLLGSAEGGEKAVAGGEDDRTFDEDAGKYDEAERKYSDVERRYDEVERKYDEVERKYSDVDRASPDGMFRFPHPRTRRPRDTKSVEDDFGGVASVDPADNEGGGGKSFDHGGFEAVDDGFDSPSGGGGYEAADDGGYESAGDSGGYASAGDGDGYESLDEGFGSTPSMEPQPATVSPGATPETSERQDIVNLGFSHKDAADNTVKPNEPLQAGHSYYFWLNIGREHKDAIGVATHIEIDKLPEEAVLKVAIFGFDKELAITPGQDVGELKIQKNGSVKVLRQPGDKKSVPLSSEAATDYLDDFLLFPISVPDEEATYRLRCNIYCGQVLVQSYVVSANAKTTRDPVMEACTKKLDYVLSESLRAEHLNSMTKEPHLLSLMMNDNGDGTHGFRFFGSDGKETFKDSATMDGPTLSGLLSKARNAMHKVSWGNEDEWDPDPNKKLFYRYQQSTFDKKKLATDLAYLARAGWRIYAAFLSSLNAKPKELAALLANPGLIQIALKLSPKAVLPAAIVYDYPWKPSVFDLPTANFELCPTFSDALDQARAGGPPLEDCACFHGGCALKAEIAAMTTLLDLKPVICPSGFWGYRHLLGLPLTLDGINNDVPPVIEFNDALRMYACVSTDPGFVERDPHFENLKKLKTELKIERDESYGPFITRLKTPASPTPQFLYFYCHGGVKAGTLDPFLEFGKGDQIEQPDWLGEGIEWTGPNPLVFINGCHTTALNPEVTLDFVSAFVQWSGAAGVIGTEITIFEPLAVKFAEECFKRFIGAAPYKEPMPIGQAVRGARLELLRQGNPLGLVYIPYAVASLRLQEKKN